MTLSDDRIDCLIPAGSSLPGGAGVGCLLVYDFLSKECLMRLDSLQESLAGESESYNMNAARKFFNDDETPFGSSSSSSSSSSCKVEETGCIAKIIKSSLNSRVRGIHVLKVLPSMRFIEYGPGGRIAPHTDGVQYDESTKLQSTTSFLLYLRDVDEGGETAFLAGGQWKWPSSMNAEQRKRWNRSQNDDVVQVLAAARPKRNAILLFPHGAPHRGNAVYDSKICLRGDIICASS